MTEPVNESGLGIFLKSEREKKGLSLEQLAKTTKLRLQYVEALENEDWGRLPSPVFIKGFVKSYTKALGLDYREVIGQFQSAIPVHDGLPRPLMPPKKTSVKKSAILIAVVVFVALLFVIALFLISGREHQDKNAGSGVPKHSKEVAVQEQAYPEAGGQGQIPAQGSTLDSLPPETVSGAAKEPENRPGGMGIQRTGAEVVAQDKTAVKPIEPPPQKIIDEPAQAAAQETVKPVVEQVTAVAGKYALTAYVIERTYIKIYVDNEPPREFIFSPGSRPGWTGNEGFFLLIGNAAGVEFDFSGKMVKGLGKQGEVVRLRLPENFNMNINE